MRPIAHADGHDLPWLADELVPGFAAERDDVFVGFENPVRQPVVAHELQDVLGWVQLGPPLTPWGGSGSRVMLSGMFGFRDMCHPAWSLTSLRDRMIKIGAKAARHARSIILQSVGVAVAREFWAEMLAPISGLKARALAP